MATGEHRETARARLTENPFYVLALRPDCTRAEVEREGQKLLGMLELELAAARTYRSPIGEHRRTPELVREAMAELRDPNRRLIHELWATLDPTAASPTVSEPSPAGQARAEANLDPFPALHALGFGHWSRR